MVRRVTPIFHRLRDTSPGSLEVCNGIDDNCNGFTDEDAQGEDTDDHGVHNLCDNCVTDWNASQSDWDGDGEGDRCDLNDGMIHLAFDTRDRVSWDRELGFDTWNAYRGDLNVLRQTGVYTQEPGTNPLADRACDLVDPWWDDTFVPPASRVAYYLTTGESGGAEGSLGQDSAGNERPNDHPCP